MGEVLQYVLLANATLLGAFVCAWVFERAAILLQLRTAYRLRLHLAIAAICAASLPVILAPITPFFENFFAMNGTDLLVSQFLKGNISLSATQFSDVLSAKHAIANSMFNKNTALFQTILFVVTLALFLRVIYLAYNMVKIRRHLQNSTVLYRTKHVDVRINYSTAIPLSTRGFLKYYILIPEHLISDSRALKIALGHEIQHIRQGDVNWEIFLSIVSPLFLLNPAFWLLTDRIRRFREYTCDAALLKKGKFAASEYCYLLLDIASSAMNGKSNRELTAYASSVAFFGRDGIFNRSGKSALRDRILALSAGSVFFNSGIGRIINFVPATTLVLVVGTAVVMSANPTDWSHDRLMLSTVVNLERLDRINEFGTAPLR